MSPAWIGKLSVSLAIHVWYPTYVAGEPLLLSMSGANVIGITGQTDLGVPEERCDAAEVAVVSRIRAEQPRAVNTFAMGWDAVCLQSQRHPSSRVDGSYARCFGSARKDTHADSNDADDDGDHEPEDEGTHWRRSRPRACRAYPR